MATVTTCPGCGQDGYLTHPGERARAELCPHVTACGACRGTGHRSVVDERGRTVVQPCDCGVTGLRARVGLYNAAGLPGRFHGKDVADFKSIAGNGSFEIRQAFVGLQDNFSPGDRGVGLSGDPGVGKTHLMVGLARYLTLERGLRVRFIDFSQLLWSLKAGYSANRSELELIRPLLEVDVLFVDEVGKGRGSPWELGIVDEIVSRRYDRGLSIFFATNFPFAAPGAPTSYRDAQAYVGQEFREPLKDRVGQRIWSRLQEMCRLEVLRGRDARPALGRGGPAGQEHEPLPRSRRWKPI